MTAAAVEGNGIQGGACLEQGIMLPLAGTVNIMQLVTSGWAVEVDGRRGGSLCVGVADIVRGTQ